MIFFVFLLESPSLSSSTTLPRVKVWVKLNPEAHSLSGRCVIELPRNRVNWIRVKNLNLGKIVLGGKLIRPQIEDGRLRILTIGKTEKLEIYFRGTFSPSDWARKSGYLAPKEGLLFGNWFPSPEGLASYTLVVELPAQLKAISSAEKLEVKVKRRKKIYTFILPRPAPAPPLVYGKYEYYYRTRGPLTVALYLNGPDPELAETYLDRSLKYIQEYEKLLGPFPYRRLSIVEINREVGTAYPTLIFFGEKTIRLPFLPRTSLPHEILHQWFGCGVYPKKANWSEGLVTYLGDWLQAEKRGEGRNYRKDLLIAHETWCQGQDPMPLSRFTGRTDRCSQSLGYGKGAFFFYMLHQQIGDRPFYGALRDLLSRFLYREADWKDLERLFSAYSRHDLSSFFQEWIERPGKPSLHLTKRFLFKEETGSYHLGLTLYQAPPYYHLKVPLVIKGPQPLSMEVEINGAKKDLEISLKEPPEEVFLDPDYKLWRKLGENEFPPNLGLIWASRGKIWLNRRDWPIYRPLVHRLKKLGYEVVWNGFPAGGLTNENLVFLGKKPRELSFLFQDQEFKNGFYLEVSRNPYYAGKAILFVLATSAEEIEKALPKLEHFWRVQRLFLRGGRVVEKFNSKGENGLRLLLSTEVTGLPLKNLMPLEEIVKKIELHRVILIGEEHDRYEHHLTQLEIIKTLYQKGHRVAIGLEMFQQPFQKYLDLFVSGAISERELLEKTEYFKRWRFDWKLYRPILLFAREKGLPVIALNVPSEITRKVAHSGLESLTLEEKASLPEIDLNNPPYRAYLFKIYQKHRDFSQRFPKFEYFYQAQVLWDEGMAEAAYNWLSQHPDYQLVILAGKGHVMYGFGIPSRLKRRGLQSIATLVLGGNERISSGFADYILYPEPAERPFSARLGVWIEKEKKGLKIVKVEKGSPAEKAGLKEGDLIMAADGESVSTVEKLRLLLTFKEKGDKLTVTYSREGKILNTTVQFN